MGSAVKHRQTALPRQAGELGRIRVTQGPDSGCVYVMTGARATIGRGEENDVILTDLKASRLHAEITLTAEGWAVKDMGSSNGILVNGTAQKSAKMGSGDTVRLGETVFEFVGAEQPTRVLIAPVRSLDEVRQARERQAEQADHVRKSVLGRLPSGPAVGTPPVNQRTRILLIAVIGVGAWLFLSDVQESSEKRAVQRGPDKEEPARNLAAMLPKATDSEISKRAEEFFRAGFREYLAGNYLRARQQFETVLQIAPAHEMSRRYIENCRIEMDRAAKEYLVRGKNAQDGGKQKEAQNQYEAVLRLYHGNQTNEHYIAALKHMEDLKKK